MGPYYRGERSTVNAFFEKIMSPVQICSDRLNVKQIRMISDGALAKACTEGGFRSLVRVNNQQGGVRKIGMRDRNYRVKG